MIEIILELKPNSFVVSGMSDVSGLLPLRALRFSCAKIASAQQLTNERPSVNFDFLGSTIQREAGAESEREFDEQLLKYLAAHATVDTSRVVVAPEPSERQNGPKAAGGGDVGRMSLVELPNQSSVNLELFLKPSEFDAAWELMAKQKILKVVATLVCINPELDEPTTMLVAGVHSCSLQLIPDL